MTIKTRINLYSESLLPAELRLSFNRIAIGLIVLLALSVVGSTISYVLVLGLESDNLELTSKENSLEREKVKLEAAMAQRSPDANLIAKVDLFSQQVDLKRMLLGELGQREALTSHGYSPLMIDLAKVANSSIWLNRFQVEKDNYIFEGFTASAHSVPLWVVRLKTTDTLKEQAFASMTMNRGENQPLSFTLTSKAQVEVSQ
ncbi:fimbrial assembly protein [Shewanella sp. D64]|uniref:PilN domain-containing protein n=1 Tax=unclassified Shewanella TaxID=196818 RepID=UPI0022BA5829|nr:MULTISPECIES: PilN domain-containing protein [unclassified Shewanella]MEC4725437.1 fimbrial assembly protein [Shewanella sp. D64]MEC4738746.1 fimbrial assembly protein [Shewanella sp. E94]WBJ95038.1 fimbrial assembly protein [Shewanella sp. MTB7]